jgi:hypothetical protein
MLKWRKCFSDEQRVMWSDDEDAGGMPPRGRGPPPQPVRYQYVAIKLYWNKALSVDYIRVKL